MLHLKQDRSLGHKEREFAPFALSPVHKLLSERRNQVWSFCSSWPAPIKFRTFLPSSCPLTCFSLSPRSPRSDRGACDNDQWNGGANTKRSISHANGRAAAFWQVLRTGLHSWEGTTEQQHLVYNYPPRRSSHPFDTSFSTPISTVSPPPYP